MSASQVCRRESRVKRRKETAIYWKKYRAEHKDEIRAKQNARIQHLKNVANRVRKSLDDREICDMAEILFMGYE